MLPYVPGATASSCSSESRRQASTSRSFIIALCRKNSVKRSMVEIVSNARRRGFLRLASLRR
jgi:hypothetical protein